jgi:hypothetical protein
MQRNEETKWIKHVNPLKRTETKRLIHYKNNGPNEYYKWNFEAIDISAGWIKFKHSNVELIFY